ncbi:MAG: ubiquitin-like protein Pup [Actinomycetota bacterium]|nr:ubiquitin-like protein Pup [Actinomycetota bacterium]
MKSTQYPPRRRREEGEALPAETATVSIEDIDDLLEEIDTLLEDQAVLTNFRQRSGQ